MYITLINSTFTRVQLPTHALHGHNVIAPSHTQEYNDDCILVYLSSMPVSSPTVKVQCFPLRREQTVSSDMCCETVENKGANLHGDCNHAPAELDLGKKCPAQGASTAKLNMKRLVTENACDHMWPQWLQLGIRIAR
jgi:hypothetical protein